MKKKVFLFVLSLALMLSVAPTYWADIAGDGYLVKNWGSNHSEPTQEQKDWLIQTYNFVCTPIDWGTHRAIVSAEEKYSGTRSLKITFPTERQQPWTYVAVQNYLIGELPAGSYTLNFYMKGNYYTGGIQAGIGWDSLILLSDTYKYTATGPDVNGWTHYSIPIERVAAASTYIHWIVDYQCPEIYIDDLSLTRNGDISGTNYATNAGLEEIYTENTEGPADFVACPRANGSLLLSWKNPKRDDITEISVASNGRDVSGGKIFSTGSEALNYLLINSLGEGEQYCYDLSMTINGIVKTASVNGVYYSTAQNVKTVGSYHIGNWSIYNEDNPSGGTDGYSNVKATIDTSEKGSGNSSIKLVSNINGQQSNVFTSLYTDVYAIKNTAYRISFKSKVSNAKNIRLLIDPHWRPIVQLAGDSATFSLWKTFSYDVPAEDTGSADPYLLYLRFIVENSCDAFYLDDVSVRALDASGNETGANLVKNGGFEFEVKNPSITGNVLSWELPTEKSWDGIDIYKQNFDGSYVQLNTQRLEYYESSFTLPSSPSTNDVYVITTVADNIVSNGAYVRSTDISVPVFDKVEFKSEFSSLGQNAQIATPDIRSIKPGNIMSTLYIKNNFAGNGFKVVMFTALYDGDKLVDLVMMEKTIQQSGASIPAEQLSEVLAIPDLSTGNYRIKTMLWDGNTLLSPLTNSKSITE